MLFQELGKLKRSSIMTSITLMALGIIMVICPRGYTGTLVTAMGFVMLIGASYMVFDFIASRKTLMNYIFLTGALILGILGASVLIFNDSIVKLVGIIFGAMLIAGGLIEIFNAMTFVRRAQKSRWWVLLILSLLQITLGLVVLVNPWWDDVRSLFQVIGGILLFSSVLSIIRFIFIWPVRNA